MRKAAVCCQDTVAMLLKAHFDTMLCNRFVVGGINMFPERCSPWKLSIAAMGKSVASSLTWGQCAECLDKGTARIHLCVWAGGGKAQGAAEWEARVQLMHWAWETMGRDSLVRLFWVPGGYLKEPGLSLLLLGPPLFSWSYSICQGWCAGQLMVWGWACFGASVSPPTSLLGRSDPFCPWASSYGRTQPRCSCSEVLLHLVLHVSTVHVSEDGKWYYLPATWYLLLPSP